MRPSNLDDVVPPLRLELEGVLQHTALLNRVDLEPQPVATWRHRLQNVVPLHKFELEGILQHTALLKRFASGPQPIASRRRCLQKLIPLLRLELEGILQHAALLNKLTLDLSQVWLAEPIAMCPLLCTTAFPATSPCLERSSQDFTFMLSCVDSMIAAVAFVRAR